MTEQFFTGLSAGSGLMIAIFFVLVKIGEKKSKAKYVQAQADLQKEFQEALIKAYRRGVTDMTEAITKKVDCLSVPPSEEEHRN